MKCFKCSADNPDDAVYCNKCGSKIEFYTTSYQNPQKQMDSRKKKMIIAVIIAIISLLVAGFLLFSTVKEPSFVPSDSRMLTPREK